MSFYWDIAFVKDFFPSLYLQSATGWFSHAVLDNFRQRIIARFLSVYPKPGAERLLKAATESFEKSKRRLSKDHVTLHEEENQVMDTG